LAGGIFLHFKYTGFRKEKTIDYTAYSGQYIVKGDQLIPVKDSLKKEMEKIKGGLIDESEFFAENHQLNDSTGAITASQLWPAKEIEKNAFKLIYLYLATVILFALAAVCCLQCLFCISRKETTEKPTT
jgi:hypothetical protein